jgi:hypothetical protein
MSVPVSIEGILERKASAVPFLFATHAACVQNEKANSVTYTFELIRYCSFGRVASFICVKMDRSAATKVPNPVFLPFPVVVCNSVSAGDALRSTSMVQPGTVVNGVGSDQFVLKGLTEVSAPYALRFETEAES